VILTGKQIASEVTYGRIIIDPFDPGFLNPNSYNLSLGPALKTYSSSEPLDFKKSGPTVNLPIPPDGLVLQPNQLYLGHTVERFGSSYFVPFLGGRSSTGRLGLFVHITAPLGDIGYIGQWTLQLKATLPVRIYPGQRIAQVFFVQPYGPIQLYSGKYQSGKGPQSYRIAIKKETPFSAQTVLDTYSAAPGAIAKLDPNRLASLRREYLGVVKHLMRQEPKPRSVLDVGCGVGLLLNALEGYSHLERIVGVDISGAALSMAMKNLRRSVLIRDDFISFPLADGEFDAVTMLAFLHLFPKHLTATIIAKTKKVLRPGGLFLASTTLHERSSEGWDEKGDLPGMYRFRRRFTKEGWLKQFSEFEMLDSWTSKDIMNPKRENHWIYTILRA